MTEKQLQKIVDYAKSINEKITVEEDVCGDITVFYDGVCEFAYSHTGLTQKCVKTAIDWANRRHQIMGDK